MHFLHQQWNRNASVTYLHASFGLVSKMQLSRLHLKGIPSVENLYHSWIVL